MKKMKKALFAVIAAFSLSACDFDIQKLPSQVADTVGGWIESVKNLITGEGEKEKEKEDDKKDQPCEHKDDNHDGQCDLCGQGGLEIKHVDENHDHSCDVCEVVLSEHSDENPKDHVCDVCGQVLSEHTDANHDGVCEYCGASGLEIHHVDENPKDHICDVCGQTISEHSDLNHDGVCDYCGAENLPFEHADANRDFLCDVCGKELAVEFALDKSLVRVDFEKGEEFDCSGLKVIATSEVGSSKEITEFVVSEPDMEQLGEQEITVSFTFREEQKELKYSITVSYWSEADLDAFDKYSLTGYAPLPYLPGSNMRVESDQSGWWIQADNVGKDGFSEYTYLLKNYNKVVALQTDVTFELEQLAIKGLAEAYGFVDAAAYSLVPTYLDGQDEERYFLSDEYLVFGYAEDGTLYGFSRRVASYIEGEFGAGDLNGYLGYAQYLSYFLGKVTGLPAKYFSEPAAAKFIMPEISFAYPCLTSYKNVYPFDSSLDAYEIDLQIDLFGGTSAELDTFTAKLVSEGFAFSEVGEGEEAKERHYVLENKYVGRIEYVISEYSATYCDDKIGTGAADYYGIPNEGFGFEFMYTAPEEYMTLISENLDNLMADLELTEADYLVSTYYYRYYGEPVEAMYSRELGESTLKDMFEAEVSSLEGLGFVKTSEPKYSEEDGEYSVEMTDYKTLNLTIYASEDDGDVWFFLEVSKYYSFEIGDVYEIVTGDREKSKIVVEYETEGEVTLDDMVMPIYNYALALGDIAVIDGGPTGIYSDANETQIFISGVTKDGKIIFTVSGSLGETGYEYSVEASEITEFELFIREINSLLSDEVIRHVTYTIGEKESEAYDYYILQDGYLLQPSADLFADYVEYYASALFLGIEETEEDPAEDPYFEGFSFVSKSECTDEGYTFTVTNGEYDVSIIGYVKEYATQTAVYECAGLKIIVTEHAE